MAKHKERSGLPKPEMFQEGVSDASVETANLRENLFAFTPFRGPRNSNKMSPCLKRKQQLDKCSGYFAYAEDCLTVVRRVCCDWALHIGALFSYYLGAWFG